jgi:Bacterial regulatory proteins, luxR family
VALLPNKQIADRLQVSETAVKASLQQLFAKTGVRTRSQGHRGVVLNSLFGALAHVGLARAYALQRDMRKARTSYEDFFTLWKDADRDIPILKQAQEEYRKLQ